MLNNIFRFIYQQPLNRITAIMLLSLILWGYLGSRIAGKTWQRWNISIFAIVILGILGATIVTRTSGTQELILTPFHSFIEARVQTEIYRTMFMNIFLFFYYGLVLPFVLPDRISHKVVWSVVSGMIFSMLIELFQYIFRLGRCETDDVLMNTLGVILGAGGYGIAHVLRLRKSQKKK